MGSPLPNLDRRWRLLAAVELLDANEMTEAAETLREHVALMDTEAAPNRTKRRRLLRLWWRYCLFHLERKQAAAAMAEQLKVFRPPLRQPSPHTSEFYISGLRAIGCKRLSPRTVFDDLDSVLHPLRRGLPRARTSSKISE